VALSRFFFVGMLDSLHFPSSVMVPACKDVPGPSFFPKNPFLFSILLVFFWLFFSTDGKGTSGQAFFPPFTKVSEASEQAVFSSLPGKTLTLIVFFFFAAQGG